VLNTFSRYLIASLDNSTFLAESKSSSDTVPSKS
jgi:hypothetical protein